MASSKPDFRSHERTLRLHEWTLRLHEPNFRSHERTLRLHEWTLRLHEPNLRFSSFDIENRCFWSKNASFNPKLYENRQKEGQSHLPRGRRTGWQLERTRQHHRGGINGVAAFVRKPVNDSRRSDEPPLPDRPLETEAAFVLQFHACRFSRRGSAFYVRFRWTFCIL